MFLLKIPFKLLEPSFATEVYFARSHCPGETFEGHRLRDHGAHRAPRRWHLASEQQVASAWMVPWRSDGWPLAMDNDFPWYIQWYNDLLLDKYIYIYINGLLLGTFGIIHGLLGRSFGSIGLSLGLPYETYQVGWPHCGRTLGIIGFHGEIIPVLWP